VADFLTMHEASGKPYGTIAYALAGDCRFNMGRSLPVMGALMVAGADFITPTCGFRRARPGTSGPTGSSW
jgi:ornithine carbamoyltransferase